MRTAWGDLAVSDAHVHFFGRRFFEILGGRPAEDVVRVAGWDLPPAGPADFATVWVEELDRHGVASAVVIASIAGDEDSVAAAVARYPGRLHGYFFVNPLAPDAPARVERALAGGLRGMCFFPAMHAYSMHDERALRLVEMARAQPGAVVFVHCGVLTVGIRGKLGLPSPFDMRFSNPVELHAVALRFPDVAFVVPHFGAGYFREALMLGAMCPNVCFDTSSSNAWMKYQESPVTLRQVFERSLDVVGPRRLLFGTDSSYFPRGWHRAIFDAQASVLAEIGVSADNAAAILGGNLRRILQIG